MKEMKKNYNTNKTFHNPFNTMNLENIQIKKNFKKMKENINKIKNLIKKN